MFFSSLGLNLELNIEQDEYLYHLTPEAGIKLDISSQGYMPFPLEKGLSLPVGFASTIGLRKVHTVLPVKQEEYREYKAYEISIHVSEPNHLFFRKHSSLYGTRT